MLRWGILSCANINRRFIPPTHKAKRSKIIAIASRSLEKAEEAAKKWDIPNFYGSYEELLNDKEINAVYIPLPNNLHVEWAIRAAERGLHCLVEKPMSVDGEGVRQLQEASRKYNVVIEEAFVHLHHPMLYMVREEMKTIGQITNLRGSFLSNISSMPGHLIWKKDLGSGAIWMLGTYPISAIIFLMNMRPVSVCAMHKAHETGVDESLNAILKFPDGVLASVATSSVSESDTQLEIFGSDGMIRLLSERCYHVGQSENNHKFEVILNKESRTVCAPNDETFGMQTQRFEETVLDGKPQCVSLELSEWIAETLAACVRSAETEEFVRL